MEVLADRAKKRRRLDQAQSVYQQSIETADQLHQLLHFQQAVTPEVRAAVNQFKNFLSSISKAENLAEQSRSLQVLRQYCIDQTAPSKDDLDFPDLISTWSSAVESGNDSICSLLPAALAQFYKTTSGILEFRDFGLSLGHTLLKRDQIRLFDRGLSSSKSKEHLISPCLRLLTEIVSFDGGALASRVFDRRDVLFKRLDTFLEQQNEDSEDDRRKASLRRMALRLLIANLRFLDATAKAEFIMHGRILRNCLKGLMSDGDDIVVDVLKSIEMGIVEEKEIPRLTKTRLFSQEILTDLAALYNYVPDASYPDSATRVRNTVQELMIKLCTTRKGILLAQSGWYPVAFDTLLDEVSDDTYIDLGLDSPLHSDQYTANVPVKNIALSQFAQSLKPESDTLQSALLLQILRSAPELVADYFSKKTKLQTISSEDPSWRSQFAFLFSVVQLPIPKTFGGQEDMPSVPPPISIVVESIIPRPFNQACFSKHFTTNDEILVLSAARLLVVALQKLRSVLNMFTERTDSDKWQQASFKLVEAVLHRVPKAKEITNCLLQVKQDGDTTRSALFECLANYHQILPEAMAGSSFDIGIILSDLLSRSTTPEENESANSLSEQLFHVIAVAELSPATKWWHKSDSESMSLFGRSFRFAVGNVDKDIGLRILKILESVAGAAGILSASLSFTALHLSIASTKKFEAGDEIWLMLDNAIHRAIQRPVKYLDQIEGIQQMVSDKTPLSLLATTVAEQWEFALKKHASQKDVLKNIAEWIARFYSALDSAGENFRVMQQLQDDMSQCSDAKSRSVLHKAAEKVRKKPLLIQISEPDATAKSEALRLSNKPRSLELSVVLGPPPSSIDSLEGIDRWDDKTDIELVIQSGKLSRLMRCAASGEEEIRRQAFQFLQGVMHLIDQSTYDEKGQVYLLLGEFVQTIRQHGLEEPLPSFVTELAARLSLIVANPADRMYTKANRFLLRSPVWDLKRLVSFWTREIIFQEPDSDDAGAWTGEADWLIQWLIDGLRTATDVEWYRRSGAFEKILALYTKVALARPTKKLILSLVWRAVCVGASDTLITRVGIQSWLRLVGAIDKEFRNVIEQLEQAVDGQCDAAAIAKWKEDLPILRD